MKKVALVIVLVISVVLLCGCSGGATNQEREQTEVLMVNAMNEVGIPNISNFYEKKMAKEIFELRDDSSLVCYAYNYVEYTGLYRLIGKCMGYGLPYSTQYTQPETPTWYGASAGWEVTPQADPNGLYTPTGLSATWLMMIDEVSGERYVMYCEPTIVVTQNQLPERLIAKD